MNNLLIFFAIPVATIILSGILETFINCPYKVAGIFFSIFLVVAFALGGTSELLVATLVYTILSFITAYIVMIFINRYKNCYRNDSYRYNNDFNNFSLPVGFNSTRNDFDADNNENFNNLNTGYRYR